MSLPTIELGRPGWTLRAWRDGDASSLVRHADDLRVWRNMNDAFPHPYTLEIARHWVARGHIDFGGDNWAIAGQGEAVGGCGVRPGSGAARCNCEIGYWLGQAFWGRGVGTEVVGALVTEAFARPDVTRVFATVHMDNPVSMRVLEKNGFERFGLAKRYLLIAGEWRDHVLFERIADA